jgi:hypothetical protein
MNISKKLDDVISKILDKLDDDSIDADEREQLTEEVSQLIDRKKELDRLEHEKTETTRKSRNEKVQFWIKLAVDILAIALPLGVTIWGTIVTVNFEKEGTFTTSAGRKHSGKALSGK